LPLSLSCLQVGPARNLRGKERKALGTSLGS
jgi:hypothetical protein